MIELHHVPMWDVALTYALGGALGWATHRLGLDLLSDLPRHWSIIAWSAYAGTLRFLVLLLGLAPH